MSWSRFWLVYCVLLAVIAVINLVNVSSSLIENPPGDRDFQVWEVWSWEMSSLAASALVIPVEWITYRLLHWSRLGVARFLAVHAGLGVAYSLLHVAGMVGIRKIVYLLMGSLYEFSHGHLLLTLIYEGRKDLLAYALVLTFFWGADRLAMRPGVELPSRLEFKTDGRTVYADPADILLCEAAGNYVELHRADAKPLLLRGTLAEFETKLAAYGFVRVHRSRLVNRARVSSFEATPSGDLRIVMDDGRQVAGSRRFRSHLTG